MQGMERIIGHWTAGGGRASANDKEHYHRLVEQDGKIVFGTEQIADNIVTSDGDYAAHTLRLNTGSIGVACCGMRGAVENPFNPGDSPITEVQFRAFAVLIAELCMEYSIPVTRRTVLTHGEVQGTLGVQQRGKWDINRLVFRPDLRGPLAVGDYLRELVSEAIAQKQGLPDELPQAERPTIREGARGVIVADAQSQLTMMGYPVGAIDGVFGPATKTATMSFQSNRGLVSDGVIGPQTWGALYAAGEQAHVDPVCTARADATMDVVRQKGSATIRNGDRAQAGVLVAAGLGVGNSLLDSFRDDPLGTAERLGDLGVLTRALDWAQANWMLCLAGVVVFGVYLAVHKVKEARVEDHRTGRNRGR